MATEDLELEPFTNDPELDFNFDEDMVGGINQEVNDGKTRSPVMDALVGTASGAAAEFAKPDLYLNVLDRALPEKSYGEIKSAGRDISKGVHDLYDQTSREIKPRLNQIIRKLESVTPESSSKLKSFLKKWDERTAAEGTYKYNTEDSQEAAVQGTLNDIFNFQHKQHKVDEAKQVVRDEIDGKRHKEVLNVSGAMARDVSILSQYTTSVTQAYQKKSLELQIRSYLLQAEYTKKSLEAITRAEAQREAITKNTALPEFVKITRSEIVQQRLSNKFVDSMFGEGSKIGRGFKRIGDGLSGFLSGAMSKVDMGIMGIESAIDMKSQMDELTEQERQLDPSYSKAKGYGEMFGGTAVGWLSSLLGDKLKPQLEKSTGAQELLARVAKLFMNPSGKIQEFRESEAWQKRVGEFGPLGAFWKAVDFTLESFTDQENHKAFAVDNTLGSLDSPAEGFTKRASLSLTTVIPGYLAQIHRQITWLRTNKDPGAMEYDFERAEFTTDKILGIRIASKLKKTLNASSIDSAQEDAFASLAKDDAYKYSEEVRAGVKQTLGRMAHSGNVSYDDIDSMMMTDAYQAASPEVQQAIEEMFYARYDSDTFHRDTMDFTEKMENIRKARGAAQVNIDRIIKSYIDAGMGDKITEIYDFLEKDKDGRGYKFDDTKYEAFLESHKKNSRGYFEKVETEDESEEDAFDPENEEEYRGVKGFFRRKIDEFMGENAQQRRDRLKKEAEEEEKRKADPLYNPDNETPSDVNIKTGIRESSPTTALARLDQKQQGYFKTRSGATENVIEGESRRIYDDDKASNVPLLGYTPEEKEAVEEIEKMKGSKKFFDAFRKTKLYKWFYKKGKGDDIEHDGPMAQDVNSNFGEEAAPGGKTIDLQSMNASFFGAIKYVGEKIDSLGEKKETEKVSGEAGEGNSNIAKTASNTGKAVNLLQQILDANNSFVNQLGNLGGAALGGLAGGINYAKGKLYGDDESILSMTGRLAGKVFTNSKDKINDLTWFIEKMTKKGAQSFGYKGIDDLTAANLRDIRIMQQAAKLDTLAGDIARRYFEVNPEYADLKITDELIEKAKNRDDSKQPPEKREILAHLGSIASDLTKMVAGLGTSAFDKLYIGAGLAKDKIVKPGLSAALSGLKHILSFAENMTGGARGDQRYTPDDLLNIRALQEGAKKDDDNGKRCQQILKQFPELEKLDTSDEAVEAARLAGITAANQSPEDRSVMSYIGNIAGNIGSFTFKTAKNILLEHIPAGLRSLNNFKNSVLDFGSKIFNQVRDVYIEGREHPVIRAKLLEIGEYRDSVTGKILETMDDLANAKGNIVDKAGNIVLTVEEMAKGLYDNQGTKIKTTLMKGLSFVRDALYSGYEAVSGFFKGASDWNFGFDSFGGGKYVEENHQALIDIRDILLGEDEKVRDRLRKEGIMLDTAKASAALGALLGDAPQDDKATETKEQQAAPVSSAAAPNAIGALGGMVNSLFNGGESGKGFFGNLKDKFTKKGEVAPDGEPVEKKGFFKGAWSKVRSAFSKKTDPIEPTPRTQTAGPAPLLLSGPSSYSAPLALPAPSGITTGSVVPYQQNVGADDVIDIIPGERESPARSSRSDRFGKTSRLADRVTDHDDIIDATPVREVKNKNPGAGKPGSATSGTPALTDARQPTGRFAKAKGLIGKARKGIFGAAGAIGSAASGLLSGVGGQSAGDAETERNRANAEETQNQIREEQSERDDYSGVDKANTAVVAVKDRAWNDRDGSGTRDGGVEDRQKKLDELKQAREKKQLAADLSLRYKGGNVIDKMLDMVKGLFGGIAGAVGGVMSLVSGAFSLIPGLGAAAGKAGALVKGALAAIPSVGSALWAGVKAIGTGYALAGKAALVVGKVATAVAAKAAMGVAGVIGTALTSHVVLGVAAVAGIGYGLYKLYQFAKRNDANEYERLRLRQYGFGYNSQADSQNHKVYMLEAYLEDGRTGFENISKRAYLLTDKIKIEELLEVVGIGAKDEEKAKIFAGWFEKRFKPIYLAHKTALLRQDPKLKLKEAVGLKPAQMQAYLEETNITDDSVYNYDVSFTDGLKQLDTNTDEIKLSFKNLIEKARIEAEKSAKKSDLPKKPEEDKRNAATKAFEDTQKKTAEQAEADKAAAAAKAKKDEIDKHIREGTAALDGEGDGKPPSSASGATATEPGAVEASSGSNKAIPVAGGELLPGDSGTQFIKAKKGAKLDGLNPLMLKNLAGMAEEYNQKTGKILNINDAVRDRAEQQRLYDTLPKGKAAKPGNSLHEFGLAFDADRGILNELEQLGLMKKYGFTRPVGQEPWHAEPAGIQKNIKLARESSEAAAVMVAQSPGRGGGGYGTDPSAARYRRNHETAMALLNAPGKEVNPTDGDKSTDATALASAGPVSTTAKEQSLPEVKDVAKTTADTSAAASTKASGTSKAQQVPMVVNSKRPVLASNAANDSTAQAPKSLEGEGDGAQPKSDGKSKAAQIDGSVTEVLEQAAVKVGIDPNALKVVAAVESGLNPNAKAKTSSASGLMQFIKSTWRSMLERFGPKYGLDPNTSPFDPTANALMGAEYLKMNQKAISAYKRNPNTTDIYMGHFLGTGGASKFFSSNPDEIAANVIPKAAAANQPIFYEKDGTPLTFNQVYERIDGRLRKKAAAYGLSLPDSGVGLKPYGSNTGQGLKQKDEGIGYTPKSLGSSPSSDGTAPSSSSSPPEASQGSSSTGPVAPSKSRPFSFDSTSPVSSGSRTESGSNPAPVSMAGVESILTESVNIQKQSLKELTTIASRLSPEELLKVVATALQAMPKEESGKDETPRKKEEVRMGRTIQSSGSSVDLKRRSA